MQELSLIAVFAKQTTTDPEQFVLHPQPLEYNYAGEVVQRMHVDSVGLLIRLYSRRHPTQHIGLVAYIF